MAGNYPDPPGNRLAYDRDGTLLYVSTETLELTALNAGQVQSINDEGPGWGDAYVPYNGFLGLVFPTPRTISHYYITGPGNFIASPGALTWSADTTNLIDGTWQTIVNPYELTVNASAPRTEMRTGIDAIAPVSGVKGLRFHLTNSSEGRPFYTLHLYGYPTNPGDRLEFWHPTLDQPLRSTPAHLDWGNRPRGTSETRQVRVKNVSSALTASDITVSVEALTDSDPSMVSQYQLAYDTGPFGATATIPSLAPGQISQPLGVRQTLLVTAPMSLWDQRLVAEAGTWA